MNCQQGLLHIYKHKGWNAEDMVTLVNASADEYYTMFKMPLGEDHRKLVASALHFREFANPERDFQIILDKAEAALRRIEQEGSLNAIRVSGLGLRPAPQKP
jgi:hypothetical protein